MRKNTDSKFSQDQLEQNSGKIIPHFYEHLYSLTVSAWMSSAQISLLVNVAPIRAAVENLYLVPGKIQIC